MAESDDLKTAMAEGTAYRRFLLLVLARKRWSIPAALAGVAGIVTAVLGTR